MQPHTTWCPQYQSLSSTEASLSQPQERQKLDTLAGKLTSSPVQTQELVSKFLNHVGYGEAEEVEKMLNARPVLALIPGKLTDCAGREFANITGFQYAVWALDYHMWELIKQYLSEEAIRAQLEKLNNIANLEDNQGWLIKPGQFINWPSCSWTPLIQALEEHLQHYSSWTCTQCNNHWNQQVGGSQLILPAHVINEYCHPSRPLYPFPQWGYSEGSLPRTGVSFWVKDGKYVLGKNFAWVRGAEHDPVKLVSYERVRKYIGVSSYSHTWRDLAAIRKLLSVRTAQVKVLLASVLEPKVNTSPQLQITY